MSEKNKYDNADRYFQNTDTGIYLYTLNPEVYKDVCREMQSYADQHLKDVLEDILEEMSGVLPEYHRELVEDELNHLKQKIKSKH